MRRALLAAASHRRLARLMPRARAIPSRWRWTRSTPSPSAPVSTVYVGNPTIADVTMIDARHAFVQGKGYGRTNIVALNRDNVQVFNTRITVTGARRRRHRHPQSRRPAHHPELRRRPLRADADAGRRQEVVSTPPTARPPRIRPRRAASPRPWKPSPNSAEV